MKRVGTFITGLLVGATLFGGTAAYAKKGLRRIRSEVLFWFSLYSNGMENNSS